MAAHDDKVGADVLGQGVNLHLRSPEYDVLVVIVDIVALRELTKLPGRLILNLFLEPGKIHRNVYAIGNAFGPCGDSVRFLAQVDGDQQLPVLRHPSYPHWRKGSIYSIECLPGNAAAVAAVPRVDLGQEALHWTF